MPAVPGRLPFEALAAAVEHDDRDNPAGFAKLRGLKAGGKMFVMLVGGRTLFKLPAAEAARLIAAGTASPYTPAGLTAPSAEWVEAATADLEDWIALAGKARAAMVRT